MRRVLIVAFLSWCVGSCLGQELLWQMSSPTDVWGAAVRFDDYDGDGADDILINYTISPLSNSQARTRIYSGRNGTMLFDTGPTLWPKDRLKGIGDFDLDGHPDYAGSVITYWQARVEIWSAHGDYQLRSFVLNQLGGVYGLGFTGRVELNGDGLPDFVAVGSGSSHGALWAFSNSGAVLYTIPAGMLGLTLWDVEAMPDLDGDGSNELLVGGVDYNAGFARGFVAVLSGRTGALLQRSFDHQQHDLIGYPITQAGDVDRDGVPDYATGSLWGHTPPIVAVYSGATGSLLRYWQDQPYMVGYELIVRHDVDLDGVPDVMTPAIGEPVGGGRVGVVRVLSMRDRQVLMKWESPSSYIQNHAHIVDLGVQTGNPYPVMALHYDRAVFGARGVLEVWRCSPRGSAQVGTGCTSGTLTPTASIRPLTTASGERARVVLGNAPAGALALCVAANAAETTYGGTPLPLGLEPLGFPACALRVPPSVSQIEAVGASGFDRGYAGIDVPFRIDPTGFAAALQWLVLDPVTGAYGVSPRCEVRVR